MVLSMVVSGSDIVYLCDGEYSLMFCYNHLGDDGPLKFTFD